MKLPDLARFRTLWPWLLVLGVALLAQAGALRAAFYMDDFHHILMRAEVFGAKPLEPGLTSRFLTFGCWRLLYSVFGPSPVAFHAFNWLLHGAVALASFGVLRAFVRLGPESIRNHAQSLALWGALLFAVHPLCTEPVHYAAQTTLLLATLLSMFAAGAFLKWRAQASVWWGMLSILCVLLAGMAKQPGFFHALLLLFFTACLGPQKALASPRRRLIAIGMIGVVAIVFVAAWLGLVLGKLGNPVELSHHWLTQARVFGEYVSRMFVPIQLSSDHHIPWTISWSDGEAVAKLLVIFGGALVILERYLRGKRWLAALLGLCFFQLLLRFAYSVDEPMVEYRTYPAMPWFGLLLVYGLREMTDFRFPRLQRIVAPTLALLCLCYASLTWKRSTVWQTEQSVVRDVLHHYPLNLRAMGIYFKDLVMNGHPDPVVMGEDMPDMIQKEILSYNSEGLRVYSERRLHLDYASCQYYIIRAYLMLEELDIALARSQELVDDLIAGRRFGSSDSLFTAYLSLLLCQEIRQDEEALAKTWEEAELRLTNAEELPAMLKAELTLLGREVSTTWAAEMVEDHE